jgi:hypothetical protein
VLPVQVLRTDRPLIPLPAPSRPPVAAAPTTRDHAVY